MTDPVSRLFLVLASTDTDKTDLKAFARWIEKHGAPHFLTTIERIREFSASATGTSAIAVLSDRANRGNIRLDARQGSTENLVSKIQKLLVIDTGLQKVSAANMLSDELRAEMGAEAIIPEYNKISFELWLTRLIERNPHSTVLHVATRIGRSLRQGDRQSLDWSLKKE